MIKHTFSDFSYAINTTSAKKGYKEIFCCFIYNGTEILRKVYIKESKGTAYIFEAKKIIDQEVRDGSLTIYSRNFIKKHKRVVPTKKSTYAASLVKAGVSDLPKGKGTLKKKKTACKPARKKPVAHKKKAAPKAIAPVIAAAPKKAPAPKKEAPVAELVTGSDTPSPKNSSGKKWAIAGCLLVAAAGITVGSIFLAKALEKDVTKYKITFAGENYKVDGKDPEKAAIEVEKGAKIGLIKNIKAEEGYDLPEEITIEGFDSGYMWDKEAGTIDFKNIVMPEKDFKITIYPTSPTGEYKITFEGDDREHYDVIYDEGKPVQDITVKAGEPIHPIEIQTHGEYYILSETSMQIDDEDVKAELTVSKDDTTHGIITFDTVMPNHSFRIYITLE